jgi:uncharacterized protein (DUF362 family)
MVKQTHGERPNPISRRDFLRTAALGAAAVSLGSFAPGAAARAAETGAGPSAQKKATVIDTRSPKWRANGAVDADYVKSMIDYGVRRLADKQDLAEAWKQFVKPTDVVGVKFNNLSYNYTNANQAIVDAITAGLIAAGVERDNIIVVEAVGAQWRNAKPPRTNEHGEPHEIVPGKRVRLTKFLLEQVDALINVPNIKDHGMAGITGCLKGMSHSRTIIDNPGPWHYDACMPGIVGVNTLEPVRTKRRLNIVNGLLAIYDGGPDPRRNQWEHNGLLFATDPVACDRVELEIIEAERKRRGLKSLFERGSKPIHVAKAAEAGLGTADLDQIEWIKVIE